jgi:hypothetical protein
MLDLWFVSLLDFLVRKKRESAGHPVAATEPSFVIVAETAGEEGASEGPERLARGVQKGTATPRPDPFP